MSRILCKWILDDKKVWYKLDILVLYFAYVFSSGHIAIHNRYYLVSLYKTKTYWCADNIKMENNE